MTNTTPTQTHSWQSLDENLTFLENYLLWEKLPEDMTSYCILRSDVRRPRVMTGIGLRYANDKLHYELIYAVEDALDAGIITDTQYTQLFQADAIIRAQRKPDMAHIWLAGAASSEINRATIDRARQSAHALTAAFGDPAIPVAAGRRIAPAETQYAQNLGVDIIIME